MKAVTNDYRYTVRIPPEVARAMAELAHLHDRSLNREILRALEAWTRQLSDPAHRETLEAASDTARRVQTDPSVQDVLRRLTDPTTQEFVRSVVEEAESWRKLSAAAFARDWDSDEDGAYDRLPQG
jgi:hypothetical protein